MAKSKEDEIIEKLDLILKVLAIQVGGDKNTGERVHLLRVAGLDNNTIAEVLETSPNVVRALASQFKPRGSK
jgi:hypothetical protein